MEEKPRRADTITADAAGVVDDMRCIDDASFFLRGSDSRKHNPESVRIRKCARFDFIIGIGIHTSTKKSVYKLMCFFFGLWGTTTDRYVSRAWVWDLGPSVSRAEGLRVAVLAVPPFGVWELGTRSLMK